jgi:hypothetical protein
MATPGTQIGKKGGGGGGGRRMERECVLFIGTQFSNLYTAVDTPGGERKGKTQKIKHSIYPGRGPTHGPLSLIIASRIGYIPSQKSAKSNAPQGRVFNADRGALR